MKLPFKLDFDEFEDEYPEIEDQRFYGFKQLALSSNFHDDSLLKEKVAADVFREAGVPSARTAFYRVYVDYGDGPVYFGLYTVCEVIDDTVIEEQFEDDSGNVYKPSGQGASFAVGTFDEASFDKETNQDDADWGDIIALFDALHSDTRVSDPAAWREGLEAVFDVDGFLRWLAVNTVVQNWDTYGAMSHNYYLYNDPSTRKLTWIPWDNNEALSSGSMRGPPSLDLTGVSSDWPLIRYLMDDEAYHEVYVAYVEETVTGAFEPETMAARYEELHDLIAPYVIGENGESDGYTHLSSADAFETALDDLIAHVDERNEAVGEFLNGE
jgi:spore coat protein H